MDIIVSLKSAIAHASSDKEIRAYANQALKTGTEHEKHVAQQILSNNLPKETALQLLSSR